LGTCCTAHLATKVREYAPNAQNGAVTVQLLDPSRTHASDTRCDYCRAPAEFTVSYYPK